MKLGGVQACIDEMPIKRPLLLSRGVKMFAPQSE